MTMREEDTSRFVARPTPECTIVAARPVIVVALLLFPAGTEI